MTQALEERTAAAAAWHGGPPIRPTICDDSGLTRAKFYTRVQVGDDVVTLQVGGDGATWPKIDAARMPAISRCPGVKESGQAEE